MPIAQDVTRRVRDLVRRHAMIAEDEWVLAAVSGGPDSICLARLLADLRLSLGFSLGIVHVHHGLRGAAAAADAAFVASFASEFDLTYHEVRRDPETWRESGTSDQEAARAMRYAEMEAVRVEHGYTRLATGHTASDQAETVLLRAIRGTGVLGLAAIRPVNGAVIRPLLGIARAEVQDYLGEVGQRWREDASNLSDRYDRNRLRTEVLPTIRESFNPRADEALARLAASAQDAEEALAGWVNGWLDERVVTENGAVRVPRMDLLELPRPSRLWILREMAVRCPGSTYPPQREQLEAAADVAEASHDGRSPMAGGMECVANDETVRIGPARG